MTALIRPRPTQDMERKNPRFAHAIKRERTSGVLSEPRGRRTHMPEFKGEETDGLPLVGMQDENEDEDDDDLDEDDDDDDLDDEDLDDLDDEDLDDEDDEDDDEEEDDQ
jgi:ribonuclease E